VVVVPRVTAHELKAWQLQSGGRGSDLSIGAMTQNALKCWARRALPVTLYTLRHSHASACHYAGMTLAEAARRLGHSQQTHVLHYSHVIEAISGKRYDGLDALIDADEPIRCSASGPRHERCNRTFARNRPVSSEFAESPLSDSNRRPLPYHGRSGVLRAFTDALGRPRNPCKQSQSGAYGCCGRFTVVVDLVDAEWTRCAQLPVFRISRADTGPRRAGGGEPQGPPDAG
jgi:hypothetical protein